MGGVFAALAVVIMNLGGLIPMATYVCPTLCMVILSFVHMACGRRIAWSWYAAVSILSLLMSPDKEAAAVFAFLGYYPILKPVFDRKHVATKVASRKPVKGLVQLSVLVNGEQLACLLCCLVHSENL